MVSHSHWMTPGEIGHVELEPPRVNLCILERRYLWVGTQDRPIVFGLYCVAVAKLGWEHTLMTHWSPVVQFSDIARVLLILDFLRFMHWSMTYLTLKLH